MSETGDALAAAPAQPQHERIPGRVGDRVRIPHLRWVIALLLLLASVLNYIDRQALSILATTIQADLGISDGGYALVVQAFLVTYAVMYFVSGRLVDRLGARVSETLFLAWWSIANMLTGLAGGLVSLAVFRSLLGMGEPGNYTASVKAVSEWFPPREKGIAVAGFSMGGTLGAAIAAPLVSFLALAYGWRAAFAITGAMGLVLAVVWNILYRRPAEHPRLTDAERRLLTTAGVLERSDDGLRPFGYRELFAQRPIWGIMVARMVTDPVWYFYLFWFPKYLQEERGYSLADIGATLWIVFIAADVGALLGGWWSGRLISGGRSPVAARLMVMGAAALVLTLSWLVPLSPGMAAPLALASLFAFAHMAWLTSITTLPIDLFAPARVGSVGGLVGAASAFGGLVSTGLVGYAVTNLSYTPIFSTMGALYPVAWCVLALLLPWGGWAYLRTRGRRTPEQGRSG